MPEGDCLVVSALLAWLHKNGRVRNTLPAMIQFLFSFQNFCFLIGLTSSGLFSPSLLNECATAAVVGDQ
jgi:hypothetical protein